MRRTVTLVAAAAVTAAAAGILSSCSSGAVCTTGSCIASDAQENLVGLVAKDEAVITKAACVAATARVNSGGTYTVGCTVTESDGGVYKGLASILPAEKKITFEPTG